MVQLLFKTVLQFLKKLTYTYHRIPPFHTQVFFQVKRYTCLDKDLDVNVIASLFVVAKT